MNPILLLSLLTLLVLLHPQHPPFAGAADIVADTCGKVTDKSSETDYNLCMALFNASAGSHEADLKGLALISINFTASSAKNVIAVLESLIERRSSRGFEMECLTQCKQQYADSLTEFEDSAKAIAAGRIDDARTWLSAALDVPYECEVCFSEGGVQSPVRDVDGRYIRVACIPLSIAALLDV